ncbi:hypothetical protein E3N88_36028 [Mikania micrantha]|uniref:Uncharacterized protein n=1 Tax=Mikania micrantha TaxID=192012 RepID=A0A5N6M2Y7_9ASTR|nr:hypothetical protein E3N88_36028 [Mikania micrantha]
MTSLTQQQIQHILALASGFSILPLAMKSKSVVLMDIDVLGLNDVSIFQRSGWVGYYCGCVECRNGEEVGRWGGGAGGKGDGRMGLFEMVAGGKGMAFGEAPLALFKVSICVGKYMPGFKGGRGMINEGYDWGRKSTDQGAKQEAILTISCGGIDMGRVGTVGFNGGGVELGENRR